LNSLIGGLAAKPVRPIIAHRDLMTDSLLNLLVRHGVHFARRLANQEPKHLCLGHQFYKRELYALIECERFSEWGAGSGVGDAFADAEGCGAEAGGCLSDAVLVQEGLSYGEPAVEGAEYGTRGDEDVSEGGGGVVGWHIEYPLQGWSQYLRRSSRDQGREDKKYHSYDSTFTPSLFAGTINAVIPFAIPALPLVLAKTIQCVATC
jgi:hypothetical protein